MAKPRTAVARKRYDDANAVPSYESVLSVAGGRIALAGEQSRLFFIGLRSEETRIVDVIYDDQEGSNAHALLPSIVRRVREQGFKPDVYASTENLITILNERERSQDGKINEISSKLAEEFTTLTMSAVKNSVSDIHLEVREHTAVIRFRRDGFLYQFDAMSVEKATRLANTIYQWVATVKGKYFDARTPQDAVAEIMFDGTQVNVRIATLPAAPTGFDMVMRVLPVSREMKVRTLFELGYTNEQVLLLDRAAARAVGAIIFAGTTGSGKTTSLATLLTNMIVEAEGTLKVITIEDPPEILIPGATQVPVIRHGDSEKSPFAAAIRGAMRCDPNIMMVGEIRDEESARLGMQATQTGHTVLGTVHAASPFGIIARLRELKIPDSVLGSYDFLSALVYQTLVPVVCRHCSVTLDRFRQQASDPKDVALLERLDQVFAGRAPSVVRFRNKEGCEHCRRGISGRTVVAQVVLVDEAMADCFAAGDESAALRHYRERGGRSVLEEGLSKIAAGIVDPRDVEREINLLNAELMADPHKGVALSSKAKAELAGLDDDFVQSILASAQIAEAAAESSGNLVRLTTGNRTPKNGENT